METFFRYNWMVREQWYKWCEEIPEEELLKPRTGGVGGILKTLFHIADVEWSWIMVMEGKPDFQEDFARYSSLQKVRELDAKFRPGWKTLCWPGMKVLSGMFLQMSAVTVRWLPMPGAKLCAMLSLMKFIIPGSSPSGPESSGSSRLPPM